MRPRNLGHSNYLKNLETRVGLSPCLVPDRAKKVMPARARAKRLIQRAPACQEIYAMELNRPKNFGH
jgi:hypothetical protein